MKYFSIIFLTPFSSNGFPSFRAKSFRIKFTGQQINRFIKEHQLSPDLIASHGHTVFHQPENRFTFQAGNGVCIASEAGIPTVADFRSGDVALGGQGAPLVPVGDRLLFSEYDSCLNLGGFANISFEKNDKRIAFDICPVNFILNDLARKLGKPFDENGVRKIIEKYFI